MKAEELGRRIRSARLLRGETQEQVAAAVDIHRTHLSRVERGREENITVGLLRRFAAHFGVSPAQLMPDAMLVEMIADIARQEHGVDVGARARADALTQKLISEALDRGITHSPPAATDYTLSDPNAGELDQVTVGLDGPSLRARVLLEDLYSEDFDNVLIEILKELREHVATHLRRLIHSQLDSEEFPDPDVEAPVGRTGFEVTQLIFDRSRVMFEVRGRVDADGTSVAAVSSGNDSGTDYIERDATFEGTFVASVWPDANGAEINDVELHVDD